MCVSCKTSAALMTLLSCTLHLIKSSCTLFKPDFIVLCVPSYGLLISCLLGELDVKWKASHLCLRRWQRCDTGGCYQRCSPLPGQGGQGLPETREGKSSGWVAVFHLLWIPRISSVKKRAWLPAFPCVNSVSPLFNRSVSINRKGLDWRHSSKRSFVHCLPKVWKGPLEKYRCGMCVPFSQCKDTSRDLLLPSYI